MMKTQLSKFFAEEQVKILQEIYAINSMEQLLALIKTSVCLSDLANGIGLKAEVFFSILDEAKKTIPIIQRSSKRYSFGVHSGT